MTWRESVVVKLLLLVARMLCDDAAIAQTIRELSTHIAVHAPKRAES